MALPRDAAARRRAARKVPDQGVRRVARDHGVADDTVRGWCREFGVPLISSAEVSVIAETAALISGGQPGPARPKLAFGHADFGNYGWGGYTPEPWASAHVQKAAAEIARLHCDPTPDPAETADGRFAAAVGAVDEWLAGEVGGPNAHEIGYHADLLAGVVDACAEIAERDGPETGLAALGTALGGWGLTGCDPDRVAVGADPEWDERRRKAEQAAETLAQALAEHPERIDPWPPDPSSPVRRHSGLVSAHLQFNKSGHQIFAERGGWDDDDDWPDLVGGDYLGDKAVEAAAAAGLEIGQGAEVWIRPSEKGWVDVGYDIDG